jgi:hypothetical protein
MMNADFDTLEPETTEWRCVAPLIFVEKNNTIDIKVQSTGIFFVFGVCILNLGMKPRITQIYTDFLTANYHEL